MPPGLIASSLAIQVGCGERYTRVFLTTTLTTLYVMVDAGRYGFFLPASEIVPTGEEVFAAVRVMAKYIWERVVVD